MQTMQDKLTEEFRRLAEDEAGLELVTDAQENSGSWYVMDGLDTRMAINFSFQHNRSTTFEHSRITMSLVGQAVEEPSLDFFQARQLYPNKQGIAWNLDVYGLDHPRAVHLAAAYSDGGQLSRVLGVVRDLLAPYAKHSGAQPPENP